MKRRVLFVCTGNHYRSRFAEILFSARSEMLRLDWQADSRGLALDPKNAGPISSYCIEALRMREVELPKLREPLPLTRDDLERASIIIALKRSEHQPMFAAQFPEWVERVDYWAVHDVIPSSVYDPLSVIEQHINRLLDQLLREQKAMNLRKSALDVGCSPLANVEVG